MKSHINVLIVGSGGREHAIAKALSRSKIQHKIHVIGEHLNPALFQPKTCVVVDSLSNVEEIKTQAVVWEIDLAIIGPEKPLAAGLVDVLHSVRIPCVGPTKNFAQLETSKSWCRDLFQKYGMAEYIPKYEIFGYQQPDWGVKVTQHLCKVDYPVVIKCDGLKGGKGVFVEGVDFNGLNECFDICCKLINEPNDSTILIEEKLVGREFSLMSFTDGESVYSMPVVCDFKRRFEGDTGPNTGGMGSVSYANHRAPFLTEEDVQLAHSINQRALRSATYEVGPSSANSAGSRYVGVLYGGFMKTTDNKIKLIEYNVRFGDPEAINALHLLETDFLDMCGAMVTQQLHNVQPTFKREPTIVKYCVPRTYATAEPFDKTTCDIQKFVGNLVGNLADDNEMSDPNLYIAGLDTFNTLTGSRAVAYLGTTAKDVNEKCEQLTSEIDKLDYRRDIDFDKSLVVGQTTIEEYFEPRPARNHNRETGASPLATKSTISGIDLPLTYKSVGVNVTEGEATVSKISDIVGGNNIGPFGGAVELNFNGPRWLVSSMDGVGSKTEFVKRVYGKLTQSLGYDIVNHCVNDLLPVGCTQPLWFMDYFGAAKLDSDECAEFVQGVAEACKAVGCELVGGETAELRLTYKSGGVELLGSITGVMDHKPQDPREILLRLDAEGNEVVLYGLRSSSPHTNGYTLLNVIADRDPEFLERFGEEACRPHRCYLNDVKQLSTKLRQFDYTVCHITGGGWEGNLRRICPKDYHFEIDGWGYNNWGAMYKYICEKHVKDQDEMLRTFNCGIGLVIACSAKHLPAYYHGDVVRLGRMVRTSQSTHSPRSSDKGKCVRFI